MKLKQPLGKPFIRSARERLFEALEVLNAVRLPKAKSADEELFGEHGSDITEKNYAGLLTKLNEAVRPFPRSEKERAFESELPPKHRRFLRLHRVRFDVPELYSARADGTPTSESAYALIGWLHWTLAQLLKPLKKSPGREFWTLGGERLEDVLSLMNNHFAQLSSRKRTPEGYDNILLIARWGYHYELLGRPFMPRLVISASGIDTQSWLTLLDFLRENPNYREILGRCPQCRRLFQKPRKNAEYCNIKCTNKAAYERWKAKGGLKKLKLKRMGATL